MSLNRKANYLNPKALKAFKSLKQTIIVIAGRGFGKSTYIGAEIADCAQRMPRSLGSLWGLTYSQILTKILPAAKKQLIQLGFKEDRKNQPGHFTIGRKPPPYFKLPYNETQRWENTLCFFNGSGVEFISADRPELIAGGSYDYGIFDEAVYFPKSVHDVKAIPSFRGNRRYFSKCPKHGRRIYTSSQTWDPSGYWVEDQKYLRDENGELLYDQNHKKQLDPDIEFIHGTSYDNIAVLGAKTLALWKKTLPTAVYDIEIMAKRSGKIKGGFYEHLNQKKHTYIKSIEYGHSFEKSEFGVYVKKKDTDRVTDLPLILGFDFGTSFNSLVVGQHIPDANELRTIREFFEASNELIDDLVDPFIEFYSTHKNKFVLLYGDPSGNKIGQMEKLNLFQQIEERLVSKGWKVDNRMIGRAYPLHKVKHQFLNTLLKGEEDDLPRVQINLFACKFLLTSMKHAPLNKYSKKGKASERSGQPQETATHLSDAWDYLTYYYLHDRQRRAFSNEHHEEGIRFGR